MKSAAVDTILIWTVFVRGLGVQSRDSTEFMSHQQSRKGILMDS